MKSSLDKINDYRRKINMFVGSLRAPNISKELGMSLIDLYEKIIKEYVKALESKDKQLKRYKERHTFDIAQVNDMMKSVEQKDKQIADFKKLEQGLCNTIHGLEKDIQEIFTRLESILSTEYDTANKLKIKYADDLGMFSQYCGIEIVCERLINILSSIKKDMVKE